MATKRELQAELDAAHKELGLWQKFAGALMRQEEPEDTIVFFDDWAYQIWDTKGPHGGWVSCANPKNPTIPASLFYVDDLWQTWQDSGDHVSLAMFNRAAKTRQKLAGQTP